MIALTPQAIGQPRLAGWALPAALQRFLANGVEIPSPATDALCAAARRAGIDVAIGVAERDTITRG